MLHSQGAYHQNKCLAVITAQLSSLGREMKKLAEQVHSVRVSCELCNGSNLSKDCPNKEQNKMGHQEKRSNLEELMDKYMEETTKRSKEIVDLVMNVKSSSEAAQRSQEATKKA
ncbi:hypothetical protein Tco_1575641 [Tanacetum coccineum]